MKNITLSALSLTLLGVASTASAQTSVTLYGLIDESLQFAHDADSHGDNVYQMYSGNIQGARWGLKGTEDLGAGLRAIFKLENGFSINTGKLGQGGREFGRQAYVGLADNRWGTLTLGRQYDPIVDLVQPLTGDGDFGSMFATPGDVDNNDNSSRTNNSIKYTSHAYSGLQFEGFYAFGGVAGSTGSEQTWSGAATYASGPFSVAAGYLRMNNAATDRTTWTSTSDGMFDSIINSAYETAPSIGIASVAAQYMTGPFAISARYSNVQYQSDAMSKFGAERYNVAGAYLSYRATPAVFIGLGYAYTHASGDTQANYNQISLAADYSLSKRTDLYLMGAYQRASGSQRVVNADGTSSVDSAVASVADYGLTGNGSTQEVVNLGIRHKF